MTAKPSDPGNFSRRAFLKGASAAAVGGTVTGEFTRGAELDSKSNRFGKGNSFGKGSHEIILSVNGERRSLQIETRTTLLDALRDGADLTGTKMVCDRGACGACTVLLDGLPINSCMTLAFDAVGAEITTIEGLSHGDELHPMQRAFVEEDALQCGFCTPGMVMAAVACSDRHAGKPSMDEIRSDMAGNICRCGTYPNVFRAIQKAGRGGGR